MRGGHAAVDTASAFAPLEKNCSWHVPKVSPLRRRAGSGPGGRLPVCVQSAGQQSQPLLPCGRDRFTFTTIPDTMPAILMICGSTIVFFNLPFGPGFWGEALVVPLPDCSGNKAQNGGRCRALEGREWKPFSNRARLGQKNNSRLATNWTADV